MSFLSTAGHALASGFKAIYHGAVAVEKVTEKTIAAVEDPKIKGTIIAVAQAEFGVGSAAILDTGFAILGEVGSLLATGDAAAEKKLTDAGLDAAVIAQVKSFLSTLKPKLQAAGATVNLPAAV